MTKTGPAHEANHTQDGVRHTIEIVVPAEAMTEHVDRVTRAYRDGVRLPGFRAGKAPLNMVRQQFADEIRQRVLDHAMPEHLTQELESRQLHPLGSPHLAQVDFSAGGPLAFTVEFDTAPDVVVTKAEFTATRPKVEVTDELIENALDELRERAAQLVPVEDGVVTAGSYARCQISLFPKDGKGKRLAEENRFVHVGDEKAIPGLNAQLDGLAIGDEREFITELAAGYPNAILAGKEVLCRARVEEIKRRRLPEIDNDLAKDLGFDDLERLRAKTIEDLRANLEANADRAVENQLLEQLRVANPVDVPETLIETRLNEMLERFAHDLAHQGIDPRSAVDWNAFRSENRPNAANAIADEMLLDRLAADHGIDADDEAVQAEIRRQVEGREGGNERTAAAWTQQMRKDGSFDGLRHTIRRRLALDHLRAHATIQTDGGDQNVSDTGDSD